jgi:hypothetical protein
MIEAWMLVLVWTSPMFGLQTEYLGLYESHEKCIYDMRNAEIAFSDPSQAMVCIRANPEDV